MRVPELEHVLHHGTAPILGYKVHRPVAKRFFMVFPCFSTWFAASNFLAVLVVFGSR